MLTVIKNILTQSEVKQFRAHLDQQAWQDGNETAGGLAKQVKNNQQLADEQSEVAVSLGNHILRILGNHPQFTSFALPEKIYPPRFNRYEQGETYGLHVDSAMMAIPNTHMSLRSDLSATLFLTEPDEYDGGELSIALEFGTQEVKLAAGDMVVYPSSSLHQVTPIKSGVRTCAFFWVQSMVQRQEQRSLLYDLDQSIQALTKQKVDQEELTKLSRVYHNLLRQWGQN
ncbi:MAG: Fe2+-dependent dioxygenase [Methylophilaceae bacterium]